MKLQPNPGFNWMAVSWGGPDEPQTETCSYCEALLGEPEDESYEIPLILCSTNGWVAQFCIACQRKWWGLS